MSSFVRNLRHEKWEQIGERPKETSKKVIATGQIESHKKQSTPLFMRLSSSQLVTHIGRLNWTDTQPDRRKYRHLVKQT